MQPVEKWELGNYSLSLYIRHPKNMVIVFASAGRDGLGEPIEEFKTSLSRFETSMLFIVDRKPFWYNHHNTEEVFLFVAKLSADFSNVGVLGESMGGSGAIVMTNYAENVGRVLSLVPQYSLAEPFILFDKRFAPVFKESPIQRFMTYSQTPIQKLVQIIYGNTDWLDAVHAGMFLLEGFSVNFVEGAGHLVGKHLKEGSEENCLMRLLASFTDFSIPFTTEIVQSSLGTLYSNIPIHPQNNFIAFKSWEKMFNAATSTPLHKSFPSNLVDLALKKPTLQSSVSEWSLKPTLEEDSAGAVNGKLTGRYGFHTALEDNPWWRVDLGFVADIHEVRIYNRLDAIDIAERGGQFTIDVSDDLQSWTTVHRKTSHSRFGGADGHPYIWAVAPVIAARYLRIRLLGRNFLHYDAIEVLGNYKNDGQAFVGLK